MNLYSALLQALHL